MVPKAPFVHSVGLQTTEGLTPSAARTKAMNLASEYKRQFVWRDWATVLNALPPLQGQTVLDLGCGVGDLTSELVARGARVIGIDMNEELLREARDRELPNTEFRLVDLCGLVDLGVTADGLWCSFTAAYFPELVTALASWGTYLRPKGWLALTEIDDLFGHDPLSARTKTLLDAYATDSRAAGRYDFRMGRRLRGCMEQSGFSVSQTLTLNDQELSFDGPALPEVIDAWQARLNRMTLLRNFCGSEFENVQEEFLACLVREDHRSRAKVHCCLATKRPSQAGQ